MFYIKDNEKIVLFDENIEVLKDTVSFIKQYQDLPILESDVDIVDFNGEYVFSNNEEYLAYKAQQERERIAQLKCTKRVFALMLQELGITYTMLKELIATNEQAQLEWDLCVELERKNPLLDVMALQLGVTSEQLDGLFRYANGEITIEQFRELIPKPDVDNSEPATEENLVTDDITDVEDVNNLEE